MDASCRDFSLPDVSLSTPTTDQESNNIEKTGHKPLGLKRVAPYWAHLRTMAKGRWIGREILEMVSTEFRDRSVEYYRFALESGVTSINGKVVKPGTIIKNADCIENIVHRHEPPVTSSPIEILVDTPQYIVVNKPGSIPVHAVARYYKQTLVHMLKEQFGIDHLHTVNRLDRLTSGLLILPRTLKLAKDMGEEFVQGKVKKEYIARVTGEFPEDEVLVDQPLLTIDRQMGLNVVHPQGKPAQTVFNRIFYDRVTDTSVLHCRPLTGRSHQIRVHLQYFGYPIANDPIYNGENIWGQKKGRGGVNITPSQERPPPIAPDILLDADHNDKDLVKVSECELTKMRLDGPPGTSANTNASMPSTPITEGDLSKNTSLSSQKLLPRETGEDIGMGSPVPLSAELVDVITRLRKMKDENEDWSRWRDVVFKGQSLDLSTLNVESKTPVPHIDNPRGAGSNKEASSSDLSAVEREARLIATGLRPPPGHREPDPDPSVWTATTESGTLYCKECYLPLYPDPDPEDLYIFLHAFRYTTDCLGSFETKMPHWAEKGFVWQRKKT